MSACVCDCHSLTCKYTSEKHASFGCIICLPTPNPPFYQGHWCLVGTGDFPNWRKACHTVIDVKIRSHCPRITQLHFHKAIFPQTLQIYYAKNHTSNMMVLLRLAAFCRSFGLHSFINLQECIKNANKTSLSKDSLAYKNENAFMQFKANHVIKVFILVLFLLLYFLFVHFETDTYCVEP